MTPLDPRADAGRPVVGGATTGTESAVLGLDTADQVLDLFSAHTEDRLGQPITAVLFRAGRIDVVWGVQVGEGREVVIKAHRPPVDVAAVAASTDAKRLLRQAGFPCPEPLSGPDQAAGGVLTIEAAITGGAAPDGRAPGIRPLLAAGLVQHIELLRGYPHLLEQAGSGPSWCQYQQGPWPVPHDPIVDFSTTPDEYAWLDAYARRASEQVLTCRSAQPVVVGHADWYAGNTAVAGGRLVGTFDWELAADTEACIAGMTAAGYASSSTSGGGLSTPEEVAGFLQDYEHARGKRLDGDEQRAAAAAAAWIVAFNARWEVSLRAGQSEGPSTGLVRQWREDYLHLTW